MIWKSSLQNKNIWMHDFSRTLRGNAGFFIAGTAVLLLFIPFLTAAMPGDSVFNIVTTHEQMKFRLIHPDYIRIVYAVVVCYAFILGVFSFRFLLDKKQTTLYFSIGLTRTKLFASRFLAGLIGVVIAVWIPMMVSLAVNRIALGGYPGMIRCTVYVMAGLMIQGVLVYALTVLACILSGTLAEAMIHGLLFLTGFSALVFSAGRILLSMVWGNSFGEIPYDGSEKMVSGLFEGALSWNPLTFFYTEACRYSMFYRGLQDASVPVISILLLLVWIVITIAVIIVALLAFNGRKAEQAQMTGGCMALTAVVILAGGFCLFSIILPFFYESGIIIGLVAGVLALCLYGSIWYVVYLRKNGFKWYRSVVATAVVSVVACFVVSGLASADRNRIPEANDVAEAQISYVGNPSYIYKEAKGNRSGDSYYLMSDYSFTDREDIESILQIHHALQHNGREAIGNREVYADFIYRHQWKRKNLVL